MSTKKKMLQAAAGSAAGGAGGLDVNAVFSTYLYTGNSTARNIVNGIDLDGEGGMIWTKCRTSAVDHVVVDTARGVSPFLRTNTNAAEEAGSSKTITAFNDNGYSLGTGSNTGGPASRSWNDNNRGYVSWTWRKAPKYLDIVTYTGSGSARTISHNLGSIPGCIMIKRKTGGTGEWVVYHRGLNGGTNPQQKYLQLNEPQGEVNYDIFGTAPTDSAFYINSAGGEINNDQGTYVAYLFAHHDGDGEFGPDSDQDIIKCGSYTGNASNYLNIDLGFEPQWILWKNASTAENWYVIDNMRGMTAEVEYNTGIFQYLRPNLNSAEGQEYGIHPHPTGYYVGNAGDRLNKSGDTYIYMAIRRGSLAPPTAGTEVFATDIDIGTSTGTNEPYAGFVTDLVVAGNRGSGGKRALSRLTGHKYMWTYDTTAESTIPSAEFGWDSMTGWTHQQLHGSPNVWWQWKRAPSFFDVVSWKTENTANRRLKHNLGVAPEMAWVKLRTAPPYASSGHWYVYHTGTANKYMYLNTNDDVFTSDLFTAPHSATEFGIAENSVWSAGSSMIGYFFATLAGVSKVGSVTHSGTTNVDCGFSAGSRFVMLKRTDANGDWFVWDSLRGIIAGNDPYLRLNSTAAEVTGSDYIDPLSSGFTITSNFTAGDYIFYAIA